MKKRFHARLAALLALLVAVCLLCAGCAEVSDEVLQAVDEVLESQMAQDAGGSTAGEESGKPQDEQERLDGQDGQDGAQPELDEDGEYTSAEEVALYIHLYGHLPGNFITKKEAQALGWPGGSLEEYAPGKSIGGDWFGNYEGQLPEKHGREYHECDIDTRGKSHRGAKRIIFSNDGLVYYTGDHYESFTLLYGEE